MQNENQCPSCGAGNDPILKNCMFCGTRMPQSSIDTLQEEELFSNCIEWLSKYETLVENPDQLNAAQVRDNMSNIPFGKIMEFGGGETAISFITVSTSIEKYINLLEVKSQHSPALKDKIEDIRRRYNSAKIKLAEAKKKGSRQALFIGLGAGIFLIVALAFLFSINSCEKDEIKKENERLENIVMQINTSVASGNIDYAAVLCSQLDWQEQGLSGNQDEKLEEKWKNKREEMLNTINTLKSKK
jgi:hypothetical protein